MDHKRFIREWEMLKIPINIKIKDNNFDTTTSKYQPTLVAVDCW